METLIYPIKFIKTEFTNNKFFYGLLTLLFSSICYFASKAVEIKLPNENVMHLSMNNNKQSMTFTATNIHLFNILENLQHEHLSNNEASLIQQGRPERDFALLLQGLKPGEQAVMKKLDQIIQAYQTNRNCGLTMLKIEKVELAVQQNEMIDLKSKAFLRSSIALAKTSFMYWNDYYWLELSDAEKQLSVVDYWKSDLYNFRQNWLSSEATNSAIFKKMKDAEQCQAAKG